MQLEDSILVLTRKIIFNYFLDCTQTMINVLIIFLMCTSFKGKNVKIKMMQCLESPIQPKGIRFNPLLNFSYFFHGQGKWWEKCSPLPWSKRQLGWGLAPFSAPKPSLQGATQLVLLAGNQVSPRHPNPFFPGARWLDFSSPALPRATWLCIWIPFVPGATKFWAPVLRNHVHPRANGWFCEQVPFALWEHTWVFQPLCSLGTSFGLRFSKNYVFVT